MRPKDIAYTMDTADQDGISLAQTTAGADDLTITGALATASVATMDIARHVSVYSTGDLSGVTFSVTGTDRDGAALTEDITGPNNTTVKGEKNFLTVTGVAVDGAVGTNVEVGSADEAEGAWVPVDSYAENIRVDGRLSSGADLTYCFQTTTMNPFASTWDEHGAGPKSGSEDATLEITTPVRAVRAQITSFSSGTLNMTILHSR